jgi:hypothetical protein
MINDYVRKVHLAMQTREEDIIMVHKNMLTYEDIELIKELEEIYDKKVILCTLQEILNNKDKNVYVVD